MYAISEPNSLQMINLTYIIKQRQVRGIYTYYKTAVNSLNNLPKGYNEEFVRKFS